MKFLLLAGDEIVGWSPLPHLDWGMGIASGVFHPNENYLQIQSIIRAHHFFDGSLGEHNPAQLEQARSQARSLDLRIQSEEGTPLPCETIFLEDFSEELEKDNIEISVLGFSHETRQKFWPDNEKASLSPPDSVGEPL